MAVVLIACLSISTQAQVMSSIGYITYVGLAAGAFGHDDPLQIQTRAMRFFQEKLLHHHAIDNPQVWVAMGDLLLVENHLASQGAHFKPTKLKTLRNEVKHESKDQKRERKDFQKDAQEAQAVLDDITSGLRGPDDYVLAAKYCYMVAIQKADLRATQEAKDHKDEKRLLDRLKLLSGETDRVSAIQTRDNSVAPIADELGSRVSFRLDAAAILERYGSHVKELGWMEEAAKLKEEAQAVYTDANALPEPVRVRLHQRYPNDLKD